jgi:hypothetical protein
MATIAHSCDSLIMQPHASNRVRSADTDRVFRYLRPTHYVSVRVCIRMCARARVALISSIGLRLHSSFDAIPLYETRVNRRSRDHAERFIATSAASFCWEGS